MACIRVTAGHFLRIRLRNLVLVLGEADTGHGDLIKTRSKHQEDGPEKHLFLSGWRY